MSGLNEATVATVTRRSFLKRALLGAAAATAASLAASRLLVKGDRSTELPGAGSIFEPRQQDLRRYWSNRVDRLRLK